MPREPGGSAPRNIVARDGVRIVRVLRRRPPSKTQPARVDPETIGTRGGVTRRGHEQDRYRALNPSRTDVDSGYRDQIATVWQTSSRRLRSAVAFALTGQQRQVSLDHLRPNVAGGTAKKCFGSPLRLTLSPSDMARSAL